MNNILIVDDNINLRRVMQIHLTKAGYQVYEAGNGNQALAVLDAHTVHLMIVDVMMPEMDGYQLTGELRNDRINIPVLMVTAKETLDDKRKGFDAGADDYLVKPVDMEEMVLHVGALLRRARLSTEHQLTVGHSMLDCDALSVTYREESATLPQKEFFLLYHLLSYTNKIFTRQDLIDEIWGYDNDSILRTVDVHINRLRERFKENPDFEIVTVRGLGYKAVIHT